VKKLGQRSSTLFTGAQEICNFVKVVEGSVVYNFGIQTLGHFGWKNWRKSCLKRATRI
jgi:hypothetical protein